MQRVKTEDRVGLKYGRLTVIKALPGYKCECICDCGNTCIVSVGDLGKKTNSCGCIKREMLTEKNYRHGKTNTRLYRVWANMMERCSGTNQKANPRYYDRGIRVCNEWKDFEKFFEWSSANGYDPTAERYECTIDRIDNNKGYYPENCRFVPMVINTRNRECVKRYEYNGQMLTIPEISEMIGIDAKTIRARIYAGWEINRVFSEPLRGRKNGK